MTTMPSDPYIVRPITRPFRVDLTPPGSKSLTNRALLLAALAAGPSVLRRPLRADDTIVMVEALRGLGVKLTAVDSSGSADAGAPRSWDRIDIAGTGGSFPLGIGGAGRFDAATPPSAPTPILNLGNAGTATRFLTAACLLARRPVIIDGHDRMRERPIGELVDLLRHLGASIEYLACDGCVPLLIHPPGRLDGGCLTVGPTLSSQYVSALLQIGPFCRSGLELEFPGPVTSPTYVAMTLGLMAMFGAQVDAENDLKRIRVHPGGYVGFACNVEPDASSASYFLAAAAITPGAVATIEGLGKGSLQGDVGFADVLARMGAGLAFGRDFITVTGPGESSGSRLRGIDVDMHHMPDAAMTLAVVCCFAQGESTIRGLGTLRHKETDRLTALRNELTKLGVGVEIGDSAGGAETGEADVLAIHPPGGRPLDEQSADCLPAVEVETYDDHRMAMALTIAGLRRPGGRVAIRDPHCVNKTYPTFWRDLDRLYETPAD